MRRKSENKLSRNLVVGCCGLALRWIGCGECLVGLFRANPTQRNSFGPVAGLMPPTLSFCLHQLWSRTLSETQLPGLGKKRRKGKRTERGEREEKSIDEKEIGGKGDRRRKRV